MIRLALILLYAVQINASIYTIFIPPTEPLVHTTALNYAKYEIKLDPGYLVCYDQILYNVCPCPDPGVEDPCCDTFDTVNGTRCGDETVESCPGGCPSGLYEHVANAAIIDYVVDVNTGKKEYYTCIVGGSCYFGVGGAPPFEVSAGKGYWVIDKK